MRRRSRAAFGLLVILLLAGCAKSPAPAREAAVSDTTGPPHGGRAIDLGPGDRAELVVDDTGMIVVRLYDASWRLLDPAGNSVVVMVATPDGASRGIPLEPMGEGSAAHFMAPMEEAVVAHAREQGSYTVTVRAIIDGRRLEGSTTVRGLATGGQGM